MSIRMPQTRHQPHDCACQRILSPVVGSFIGRSSYPLSVVVDVRDEDGACAVLLIG